MLPPNNIQTHSRHRVGLILALVGLVCGVSLILGTARLATAQADAPSWSYTGCLNTARSGHTATLLPSGKVLVAGGGGFGALSSAELYDPVNGAWGNTGSLNTARYLHTATMLPNGKVLVAGGFTGFVGVSSAELYDPVAGSWSFTSSLNVARIGHSATLLPSGKVLVAGGIGSDTVSPLGSAELYDPATGTWSSAGTLSISRYSHTATLLQGGKVLVVGGCLDGDCDIPLNIAELYDPNTGAWSITGRANALRQEHTATLLPNGQVLVVGGGRQFQNLNTNELYNPATERWSFTSDLIRHTNHSATLLPNGKVLIAAGVIYDGAFNVVNSALVYDPATGMWGATASLNMTRSGHTATLLQNGKVLVVGGGGGTSAELYDSGSSSTVNLIDDPQFFVRQQYLDFLGREPDDAGLTFWTNEITSCDADAQCAEVKRVNVSAAFFLSIEFQETGYLVERMYIAAYGDATSPGVPGTVPIIRRQEFLPDAQRIAQGVRVGIGDWQQQLEQNKQAYALDFVRRQRFRDAYPQALSAAEFVDTLNARAGGALSPSERAQLVAELAANDTEAGRAAALRKVAEDEDLRRAEFNRAFVLMQYYGYLRRDPDDPPDVDFGGWKFWLDKLNDHGGNFVNAEMVKSFLISGEYRKRFGQ